MWEPAVLTPNADVTTPPVGNNIPIGFSVCKNRPKSFKKLKPRTAAHS